MQRLRVALSYCCFIDVCGDSVTTVWLIVAIVSSCLFVSEFLQSCSNKRTDAYGGSIENRFRLLKEVVEAVTKVYPANKVGVRLSPNGAYNGQGSEDNIEAFTYYIEQLDNYSLAAVHVMDGLSFGESTSDSICTLLVEL